MLAQTLGMVLSIAEVDSTAAGASVDAAQGVRIGVPVIAQVSRTSFHCLPEV